MERNLTGSVGDFRRNATDLIHAPAVRQAFEAIREREGWSTFHISEHHAVRNLAWVTGAVTVAR
jgi:hypothetical protein